MFLVFCDIEKLICEGSLMLMFRLFDIVLIVVFDSVVWM